jgi:hypothetical protein
MDGVALFLGLASLTLGIISGIPFVTATVLLNLTVAFLALSVHPGGPARLGVRDLWCLAPFLLLPGLLAWGGAFNYDAWEPGGSPAWAGPVVWLAVLVAPALGVWLAWSRPGVRWFLLSLSAFQAWLVYCTALVSYESVTGLWL